MKEFMKKYPLAIGVLLLVIFTVGLHVFKCETYLQMTLYRIAMSALCILVMWPIIGTKWLKFPGTGWKDTFSILGYYLIILAVVIGVVVCAELIACNGGFTSKLVEEILNGKKPEIDPNWFVKMLTTTALCASVGVVEELIYRRGLFEFGMLQFPRLKNKAMWMAVITSFVFGFTHVMTQLSWDGTAIVSAIFKTIGTGMFGFIMCGSLIEGKNIWAVAAVHGLNDLIPKFMSIFQKGEKELGKYVTTSADNVPVMLELIPVILIALVYLPAVIKSVKIIKKYDEENNI